MFLTDPEGQNPLKKGLRARRISWWVPGAILTAIFVVFFADFPAPSQTATPVPVILISVDTLRADHLSSYGYRARRTPNIDSLTQGGTLFSQVNSQVPLTLPSHASMLTSTYPFSNGMEDNAQQLGPGAVTLAGVLNSHGYRTAAFVGGFVLDRRFGLDQGFDVYDSPFDLHRERGKDPGDIKRLGENVARAAILWLEQNSDAPFFLFLHLYDLHTPYNLPQELRARHGAGYDGELGYVDEILGQILNFLKQRGLYDRSLIVFTSDHGEGLGEHGETTHGYFIYQSTLWVPLIVHWPAGANSFRTRIDAPCGVLDVAPTILEFLGVPRPPEFQGRSLLDLVQPKASGTRESVYGESLYGRNHFRTSPLRSLRDGRYKYIEAPKPELYDLEADPRETRNLYLTKKSVAVDFRERLLALRARYRSERAQQQKVLSPEALERLSSLGYVAVSSGHAADRETGPDPKDRLADFEKYGRAIQLASAGRLVEANAMLNALIAKDPGLPDVRISLGLNDQRLGRHEDAAKQFRDVLAKDPLNILAHYDLGVSLYKLQKFDEATKELEAALAIAPYYTNAEGLLATIQLQKKDYQKARAHLEHVLAIAPGDYGAHYNLGVLETLQGRWEEGAQQLSAALETDPSSAEAHNSLGSVYLQFGDLDQARSEFSEAVRLDPKFAWAHYNLGLVFRRENKNAEAARAFRQALAADPKFQPAREALERLQQQK